MTQPAAPQSLRDLLARHGYEYVKNLGHGGFGVVYLVNEILKDGTPVPLAVKRVGELTGPSEADVDVILGRASKEASTIIKASGRTKYLVRVLRFFTDVFDDRRWGFFVMEYIAGGDLARWLERPGLATVPQALRIVRHISLALQAIQVDKVVHRDIKPSNIMVTVRDNEEEFLLADFSLMRTLDGSSGFSNFGSAGYLAPEQADPRAFGPHGFPVDVYALGSVLYKTLTGKPAIDAENREEYLYRVCNEDPEPMSARRPELAAWRGLDELGLAMTARRQGQRPTIEEILRKLPHIVTPASEPTRPRPLSLLNPVSSSAPHSPLLRTGAAVFAALLTGVGYVALNDRGPLAPQEQVGGPVQQTQRESQKGSARPSVLSELTQPKAGGTVSPMNPSRDVSTTGGGTVAPRTEIQDREEMKHGSSSDGRKGLTPFVALETPPVKRGPDGSEFVWIRAGHYRMGCSVGDGECGPSESGREVSIAAPFWIQRTEVASGGMPVSGKTWDEADRHCKSIGGRLPTEAEWEFAARGGEVRSRYGPLDRIAWYGRNSGGRVHAVADLLSNRYGTYDMLGNLWEWVQDWYPEADLTLESRFKTVRGGAWNSSADQVRASARERLRPSDRSPYVGFRCVCNEL